MKFKYTTAIKKVRRLDKRIKVVQGGSSAGKTIAILAILIDKCTKTPNLSVSIVSENIPHLKRGAIRDFIKILKVTNRYFDNHWNRSVSIYKFANGSYVEFFGADNDSKLRGARRDILYLNECNNIRFESYQQLAIRTNKSIYLDYNPVRSFWVHTEIIGQPDVDFLKINYKDNEALNKDIVNELEKAVQKAEISDYWKNFVKVYVDGELGVLEGAIYNNWKTCNINTVLKNAEFLGLGLDFGFTNDPTACIAVYKYEKKLVLEELFYETNLLNSEIAKRIKQAAKDRGWGTNFRVVCDSSEPKSIMELKRYNLKAYGVAKGRDSVTYGISLVQEFDLLVDSQSNNLITELESYSWTKKKGKTLNVPEDKNNHATDAFRYFIMDKFSKRKATAKPFVL